MGKFYKLGTAVWHQVDTLVPKPSSVYRYDIYIYIYDIYIYIGVQQGDSLGPLLFSLVLMEFLDDLGPLPDVKLKLWYWDDGSFLGQRASVACLLDVLLSKGSSFDLHINLNKCEVFWPSGDQNFPTFATEIQRSVQVYGGVDFLGCPLYGSSSYVTEFVSQRLDKNLDWQDRFTALEDPQVELHLLRSCLSLCKLNHIIRTIPGFKINDVLMQFDSGLYHSLEALFFSSVSDLAWKQATLPVCLGGLGLREASRSSSAAFVGSCNSCRQLSLRLLNDSAFMPVHEENDWTQHSSFFPCEEQCRPHLASLYHLLVLSRPLSLLHNNPSRRLWMMLRDPALKSALLVCENRHVSVLPHILMRGLVEGNPQLKSRPGHVSA